MAHFAQMDANNNVLNVIVVNNATIDDLPFPESEPVGVAFCQTLFGPQSSWLQTSYNGNFRYRYAQIGGCYLPQYDEFAPPKPNPTWIYNPVTHEWEPPLMA
jgi:hypothetical protein